MQRYSSIYFGIRLLNGWGSSHLESKRQATVALSTVEAEYVAMSRCAQQMVWMQSWLDEVEIEHSMPGVIKGDNRGAMALTKNTKDHGKVKHIDIRHHYICELLHSGAISVEQVSSADNLADLFMKPLPWDTHHRLLAALNISNWALVRPLGSIELIRSCPECAPTLWGLLCLLTSYLPALLYVSMSLLWLRLFSFTLPLSFHYIYSLLYVQTPLSRYQVPNWEWVLYLYLLWLLTYYPLVQIYLFILGLYSFGLLSQSLPSTRLRIYLLETEGYELLFPPPTEVFIYVSTIYLQSSGVIYNIKYYQVYY